MKHTRFFLSLLFVLVFSASAQAVDFEFSDREDASDRSFLGRTLALNQGFLLVGAPEENVPGGRGRVYLYRVGRSGLSLIRPISSRSESPREFGEAVASDGDWAAIGSRERVDLYRRSGDDWNFVRTLDIPDAGSAGGVTFDSEFGSQLEMSGDRLIVGDSGADLPGDSNVGAAAIFGRNIGGSNAWGLEGVLLSPGSNPAGFARGVAIDGNLAVVAEEGIQQVHVYRNAGGSWQFLTTLVPQQFDPNDGFGICANRNSACLDIQGDFIAVGARAGNAAASSNSGSVHVFERNIGGTNQFGQIAEVVPSFDFDIDVFGQAVKLDGELLFVSAPGNTSNRLYIYSRRGPVFQEEQVVLPPATPAFGNIEFGSDIAYDAGNLIIGSERWDDNPDEWGAVFSYYSSVLANCPTLDAIFCDRFER
jgi:hypothetical protein